ncbi:hypothetical protein MED222_08913 [Vibrio sp. MED222]|nr:hypothetical protein MED222_08913 [Vibrio sp. MED222]
MITADEFWKLSKEEQQKLIDKQRK